MGVGAGAHALTPPPVAPSSMRGARGASARQDVPQHRNTDQSRTHARTQAAQPGGAPGDAASEPAPPEHFSTMMMHTAWEREETSFILVAPVARCGEGEGWCGCVWWRWWWGGGGVENTAFTLAAPLHAVPSENDPANALNPPTCSAPRIMSSYTSRGERTTHSLRPSTNTPRRRSSLRARGVGGAGWSLIRLARSALSSRPCPLPSPPPAQHQTSCVALHPPDHEVGALGLEQVGDDLVVDLEV